MMKARFNIHERPMALKKITLQLGCKTVSLTKKQFEELKADMRELDRQHHYYWHHSPWYGPWYSNSTFTVSSAGVSSGCRDSRLDLIGSSASNVGFTTTTAGNLTDDTFQTLLVDAKPPEFTGKLLSVA